MAEKSSLRSFEFKLLHSGRVTMKGKFWPITRKERITAANWKKERITAANWNKEINCKDSEYFFYGKTDTLFQCVFAVPLDLISPRASIKYLILSPEVSYMSLFSKYKKAWICFGFIRFIASSFITTLPRNRLF